MKSAHFLTALGSLALNSAFGQGFMSGDSAVTDELSQKSSIQMVAGKTYDPALASYYQRFVDGIPLHGARVVAESGGNDFLIPGLDQFADPATFDSTYPAISKDLAATVAEANAEFPVDSEVNVVWFQTNTHAKLCWEVVTTLADSGEPVSPTHMEAIVDGQTGELLSQRQIDINNYDPSHSTQTEWGIFPRIVVNNAMGISGGRSYGAAFDAVVSVGGGCSGTLIAPNVVLCARHCGAGPGSQIVFGDNLNGGGLVFRTVQSSFLPDGGGSLLDGGDVSILTLSSPVPASVAVPMRLIDETNELEGMRCATVGYGLNGLGSSGHNFSSDGYRWGGENIIDRYGSPASGGGGSNIISTDFDNGSNGANSIGGSSPNPLQYEATTAGGDSGGPVLVELGGEWVIAGVLSGGTTSTSTYGDVSWWTGTAVYRTAIESRGGEFGIPAPGACCFANGSCVSVFNDECDSAGGSFEGASTNCAPSPCPPPSIGACCF
ncbi:MAG: trypsin-like serine protease, partial [Planctomycetota bacterium]|nr:trypsin-like serine protease [Planctomycetota bacterium]